MEMEDEFRLYLPCGERKMVHKFEKESFKNAGFCRIKLFNLSVIKKV
jgi:hypothetical protein